ncbi:MAG TPA: bifunctional diaminohydroxyphosphoribosylaminopyrimidine deaminase/5-amino-6-(5-phosphoribosylamino)uracil reductase RibD [Candidatus Dormibacteraeota bacterium]|nr:bifunctional diaminohydroxyphosphoribosylaminopyrimidine deaminase/5-amino-6-(5-phosphoribosylamino)uracil reductase RibD [Candidatus Dormibacteraeota bacterium]
MPDEQFMDEALKLAKRAAGWTNPNPMVGAVIVKDGKVIGQGYHHKAGSSHAEIEALKAAGSNAAGATLYVNLEPCTHHGRTPPCTDAIIASGISRVVCAMVDPNPRVSGQGIKQLRAADIDVTVGPRSTEAQKLNEAFFTFHEKQRPFIVLKFATSLDGKLASRTGDSKWITNEAARAYARSLRAEYQAVLVGINTVLSDDPQLGARRPGKKDPLRVIVDSRLQIPLDSQALRDNNVLIATTAGAPGGKKRELQQRGVQVLAFPGKTVPVNELLTALAKQDIISVLVEGGGRIIGSFIDAGAVDKVYAFYAPLLVGGAKAVSIQGEGAKTIQTALRLRDISFKHFQDNFLVSGYPET